MANRTTAATGRPKTVPPKTEKARLAVLAGHTKRSPEREALVLKGLRLGMNLVEAGNLAGVSKVTIKNWRDADPGFDAQCSQARAELEARMLGLIEIAAKDPKTWGAAAWKLERLLPDRYGRATRVEMTGRGGGPIEVMDVRKMSDEELRKIASGEITTYEADDEEEV